MRFVNGRISRQGCVAFIVFFAVVGGIVFLAYRFRSGPERVQVTFQNASAETLHLGVVYDIDGHLHSIPQEIRLTGSGPLISSPRFIRWKVANRYGVIAERVDGSWWVTWFEPAQVPVAGRNFLSAGGSVDFDLAKGVTERLSQEQVRRLGLIWGR